MDGTDPAAVSGGSSLPEQAGDRSFGLMRIAGALLALPAEAIREVIPGASSYSPMPIKARGLRGAVNLRGTTIPVLDLREILGLDPIGVDQHVVLIMRCQGRLIGLIADEVCGLARVPSPACFALAFAGPSSADQLATHTFQSGDDVATVLSSERIASLPNLPLVVEPAAGARQSATKATESVLLFTCGSSHLGINATCVDATVPQVRIERNALTSGFCLGIIEHHGFEVPVVQTRAAIGLASDAPPSQTDVIVIRFAPEAMLGFAIDEVRDIVRIADADILRMPPLTLDTAGLFRGLLADGGGREHLLLDIDRMRAERRLSTLAGLRKPRIGLRREGTVVATQARAGAGAVGNANAFLTYVAGAERATPLTQVSAILPYPEHVAPLEHAGGGILGLFTYRGRVVPLVCLGTATGQPCRLDRDSARILLVDDGETMLGFAVELLRSIENASWHSPAEPDGGAGRSLLKRLLLVGAGEQRRMMSHVDLMAQVAQYRAQTTPLDMDLAANWS